LDRHSFIQSFILLNGWRYRTTDVLSESVHTNVRIWLLQNSETREFGLNDSSEVVYAIRKQCGRRIVHLALLLCGCFSLKQRFDVDRLQLLFNIRASYLSLDAYTTDAVAICATPFLPTAHSNKHMTSCNIVSKC